MKFSQLNKLQHLEGLRGISAFIVFIAHFIPTFSINAKQKFLDGLGVLDIKERLVIENFISIFYEGTLPVFIFWFLSAYVISIKLFDLSRNENNRYLVEASTKRYFRFAIPVFFSSLICFVLIKFKLIYNHELGNYLGHGYNDGWLSLWYNFDPGFIQFLKTTLVEVFLNGNCNYNIALWTMTPELMGSLLCFGLFGIAGRNKYRYWIYLVVAGFFCIAGIREVNYFVYLTFLIGVVWCDATYSIDMEVPMRDFISKILKSKILPVGVLVISFATTIFSDVVHTIPDNLYYLFNFPAKAIGFTLLINNFGIIRKLFSIRPLRFMGKLSFSFYLLHIPVMFSAGIYLYLYGGIESPYKTVIVFLVTLVLIIFCSYLFMKLVDRKAIIISDRIGKFFSAKD